MPPVIEKGHVDQVLTGFSVRYTPPELVAKRLFPVLRVEDLSGTYYKYIRDEDLEVTETVMSWHGEAPEVSWSVDSDTYKIIPHGLKDYVSPEDQQNLDDPFDAERDTTEKLKHRLLMKYEVDVATTALTAATYPAANVQTLSGTARWDDYANSIPISNVRDAIAACVEDPNLAILAKDAYDTLVDHPDIIERMKSGLAVTNVEMLQNLFDIPEIAIASGKKKVAGTESYIWSESMVFAKVVPRPTPKSVTFGMTFAREQDEYVRTWEVPERGPNGAMAIQAAWNRDHKVVANQVGALITDILT